MNRHSSSPLLAALALFPLSLPADDGTVTELAPTVVTATRSATPAWQLGSSVTVLTQEDLARRQVVTVADALRVVPGLDVLQSGGLGKQTSVFLRGANSNHTLVLIDGIEVNDPSAPNNGFDFANLTVDNIERIEILRGGESSLYGSDAIGGVIQIFTKKGAGKPRYSLQGQGGTYDTFRVGGDLSGAHEGVDYSLSASRLESRGFSAADEVRGNSEPDGYRNTTVSTRLGVRALENLDFGWNLRYNDAKVFLDSDFPTPHDDPNYSGTTEELYTRGFGHLKLLDQVWEQTLGVAYSRTDRQIVNRYDPANPFSFRADYLGEKTKIDWQNILHLTETNTLTLGVEDEEDRLTSPTDPIGEKSYNTQGYYLLDQIGLGRRWFTTAAVRYDKNNRVGGKVTWRITQALVFDATGTKLKGSYGTGFKVPSLVNLFDRFTGNPQLLPETSRNWDVGIEQSFLADRIALGASYFHNDFNNLIQFNGRRVENVAQATAEGVESFLQVSPWDVLTLRGTYTYTHAVNNATSERLIRRPTHKGSLQLDYRFMEKADLNFTLLLVGDKDDIGGTRVPGYVLANLATSYQVNDHLRLFARVDNLFDKRYEEIYGYGTSRIAPYGGIALSF
ncbi:TonB-dependent receptor plug domain-containing protein [Candidatus Methylocalor cossyra]|uniref:TonB-dependent receptor n=1 Tax=Candidatus Methylocalor cossyra TaxID=3108543 RepID=A0ABM9NKV4_9GAMM